MNPGNSVATVEDSLGCPDPKRQACDGLTISGNPISDIDCAESMIFPSIGSSGLSWPQVDGYKSAVPCTPNRVPQPLRDTITPSSHRQRQGYNQHGCYCGDYFGRRRQEFPKERRHRADSLCWDSKRREEVRFFEGPWNTVCNPDRCGKGDQRLGRRGTPAIGWSKGHT